MHISGWCPSSSARFASEFTKTIASLKFLNLKDPNKCPSLNDHKGTSLIRIFTSLSPRGGVPPSQGTHLFSANFICSSLFKSPLPPFEKGGLRGIFPMSRFLVYT